MKKIIFTVSTLTYSLKSQKILSKNGINSKVIKMNKNELNSSCIYGIEVDYNDFYSAVDVLKQAQINYSVYNGG